MCKPLGESVKISTPVSVTPTECSNCAESERSRVTARFYRLDRSRSLPGNGLGLTIVEAISHLHGGSLVLEDAAPGLRARIVLPRPDAEGRPATA